MKIPPGAHVAVVDGERFLLMRNRGSAFEPELVCEAEPEVSETNHSAGVQHQDRAGDRSAEPLDRLAHAAGVAQWLNHAVLDRRIEQLVVVASPDALGEMRRHYHKETSAVLVGEVDRQLTSMPAPEIARLLQAV